MARRARAAALLLFAAPARGAVDADVVTQIPGFNATPFKVYSGYIDVPGPINGYDSLSIHYQFNTAQADSASKPVVAWHQGGPGGSSVQGGYIEMGFFQVDDQGTHSNPWAWNNVANMLYLESPAGSGQATGFSTCVKGGKPVRCSWNDKTQAEAYGHTLAAFFKAFPEFSDNDFFIAGESYFGNYGPNIAHFLLNNAPYNTSIRFKGMMVGNGCWGAPGCNGPNSNQNDADMYYGKGLISKKLYDQVYAACNFPSGKNSAKCEAAMLEVTSEVGPHNVYNIYDNCPKTGEYLNQTGRSMRWLVKHAREQLTPQPWESGELGTEGGYDWSCGGTYPPGAVSPWMTNPDVQKALHLNKPGLSSFMYIPNILNPTVDMYPELVKKIRVLIYNGDADACVPYNGNEEWTSGLEEKGVVTENEAWRPWFTDATPNVPAGYVTTYNVTGSDKEFSFVTIRLAGHMVPMFRPDPALTFFGRFLAGKRI